MIHVRYPLKIYFWLVDISRYEQYAIIKKHMTAKKFPFIHEQTDEPPVICKGTVENSSRCHTFW